MVFFTKSCSLKKSFEIYFLDALTCLCYPATVFGYVSATACLVFVHIFTVLKIFLDCQILADLHTPDVRPNEYTAKKVVGVLYAIYNLFLQN